MLLQIEEQNIEPHTINLETVKFKFNHIIVRVCEKNQAQVLSGQM